MENEELQIRSYHQTDKPALMSLMAANIPKYFHQEELSEYAHYLDNEIEDYFVLCQGTQVLAAGGINYDLAHAAAKISWDIVDIHSQKQGFGSRLLLHRLAHICSQAQIQTITVRTSQYADVFYEKHGFQELERHKDYWAPGFDMVLMAYQKDQ